MATFIWGAPTMSENKFISINDAAATGVDKLRKPYWANADDHIKIEIVNGKAGVWLRFYSDLNETLGNPNPVELLGISADYEKKEWIAWEAPWKLEGYDSFDE